MLSCTNEQRLHSYTKVIQKQNYTVVQNYIYIIVYKIYLLYIIIINLIINYYININLNLIKIKI